MRTLTVVLGLACMCSGSARAQPAPVATRGAPRGITNASIDRSALERAKTAHLVAEEPVEGSRSRTFQQLRAALERWHRFDIVDRPDRADVTITLSERDVQEVAFGTNAPVGAALVNPKTATVSRHIVAVTLRRRLTGDTLWRGEAATVDKLIEQLQEDARSVPTFCIAVWCR